VIRREGALVLALFALAAPGARAACSPPQAGAAYTARVGHALRAGIDLWGAELLRAPGGPTYERASRYLAPLLYARKSKGRPLTSSGVYYLPFAQPAGPRGAGSVALHVADGSEIRSESADGPGLTVGVGGERYGSCLARLTPAKLASGWLPVLQTRYAGFAQESFAARVPEAGSLVSFVRVEGPGEIRFTPSVRGLRREGNRLVRGGRTYLVFGAGGRWRGGSLVFLHGPAYAAWLDRPGPSRPFVLDAGRYAQARAAVAAYWSRRLAEGASLVVPEARVMNAQRALLVQNLELAWRYSIGNPYEEFSFPESLDGAQVMAELGFGGVSRSILRASLTRRPTPYPSWKMGEKLLGAAVYVRLFDDRAFLGDVSPTLAGYVTALAGKLGHGGLLASERFSSDIADSVQGFHAQAVAWEGLTSIAAVWALTGHPGLAARARGLASRLGAGLRAAVRASELRLPDGSLFLPMRLNAGERAYDTLTESHEGSYWNLVAPYALASGLFPAASPEADGALRYLLLHGSRLLGLVRAGGYALYGPGAQPMTSGTDQVYGLNAARFLAAEGEPDELVLSLYGQLAAGMTPNTFVAGEGATVAPLAGQRFRAMYLPPNSVSNDAFLETLRLMLVQETRAGLRLAFATPRGWLGPGHRIEAGDVPTRFGPLSYSLEVSAGGVRVHVDLPARARTAAVQLRLRLPGGRRIRSVAPAYRFDPRTGTIDLSGRRGALDFLVRTS
jgi:hypothetical protein